MHFRHLTVCLDMHGCPNRCRHCWLGHTPNGRMPTTALHDAAAAFRPFTDSLEIDYWYREPDFSEDYRELWNLTTALSDRKTPHFELVSVWRLVRDASYVDWLKERGVQAVQLTLFGGEVMTDRYTGRKGAYREILSAVDILLQNGIVPRIQTFVNRETLPELPHLVSIIRSMGLEARCTAVGKEFSFFLHQGSCDGANENNYDLWLTPADLAEIPPLLMQYTCRHFGTEDPTEIFGRTEAQWYSLLADSQDTENIVTDTPVFYIDHNYDVFPNITTPSPHWRLGNLYTDNAETILQRYTENSTPAQHIRASVPFCEIVRTCGNPTSQKLFCRGDYTDFLRNRFIYCHSEAVL
ncbi:MAG: radical SAM protein [Ruminococcaceae bacterium]|nr:radical SAM protein [Oscillospiraceae bacterium]